MLAIAGDLTETIEKMPEWKVLDLGFSSQIKGEDVEKQMKLLSGWAKRKNGSGRDCFIYFLYFWSPVSCSIQRWRSRGAPQKLEFGKYSGLMYNSGGFEIIILMLIFISMLMLWR